MLEGIKNTWSLPNHEVLYNWILSLPCAFLFQPVVCLVIPCIKTVIYFSSLLLSFLGKTHDRALLLTAVIHHCCFGLCSLPTKTPDWVLEAQTLHRAAGTTWPRQKLEMSQVSPSCFVFPVSASSHGRHWFTSQLGAGIRRSHCSSPSVHSLLANFMRELVWRLGPRDAAAGSRRQSGKCFLFLTFGSTLTLGMDFHVVAGWVSSPCCCCREPGAMEQNSPSNPWESCEETTLPSLSSHVFACH